MFQLEGLSKGPQDLLGCLDAKEDSLELRASRQQYPEVGYQKRQCLGQQRLVLEIPADLAAEPSSVLSHQSQRSQS